MNPRTKAVLAAATATLADVHACTDPAEAEAAVAWLEEQYDQAVAAGTTTVALWPEQAVTDCTARWPEPHPWNALATYLHRVRFADACIALGRLAVRAEAQRQLGAARLREALRREATVTTLAIPPGSRVFIDGTDVGVTR